MVNSGLFNSMQRTLPYGCVCGFKSHNNPNGFRRFAIRNSNLALSQAGKFVEKTAVKIICKK